MRAYIIYSINDIIFVLHKIIYVCEQALAKNLVPHYMITQKFQIVNVDKSFFLVII